MPIRSSTVPVLIVALALHLGVPGHAPAEPIRGSAEGLSPDVPANAADAAPTDAFLGLSEADPLASRSSADARRINARVLQSTRSSLQGTMNPADPADGFALGGTESAAASGMRDLLRSYVNVPRGSPGNAEGRTTVPGRAPLGVGSLPEVDWVHEAMEDLITSVLRPNVNDRGEATFSMVGIGEFGLMLSADRNRVSLVSGDDVLLTAERVEAAEATRAPDRRRDGVQPDGAGSTFIHPGLPIVGASTAVAKPASDPISRMQELILDLLTHPVALLAVALVLGYFMLSGVLKLRSRRSRGRHRRGATHGASPSGSSQLRRRTSRSGRSRKRSSRQSASPSTHRA